MVLPASSENDTHDTDPAMIPVLFEGLVNNRKRSLVAVGDKGGDFVILDRRNGEVVHRTVVDTQEGLGTPPTKKGRARLPESWWRHTMEWRCI